MQINQMRRPPWQHCHLWLKMTKFLTGMGRKFGDVGAMARADWISQLLVLAPLVLVLATEQSGAQSIPDSPGAGLRAGSAVTKSAPSPTLSLGRPVAQKLRSIAAGRKAANGAAGSPSLVAAPIAAIAAPRAAPSASQQHTGKLENYIRNNESVRTAERLRSDPRVNQLPTQVRADFLNEYGVLMFSTAVPSRDSLIARTHALDQEQMEMEDRAIKFREDAAVFRTDEAGLTAEIREHQKKVDEHNKAVATYTGDVESHNTRVADYSGRLGNYESQVNAHNAEAANYSSQCLSGPLPPAPYARCVSWQSALNARKATLDNWKSQLDAEQSRLNQNAALLNSRKAMLEKTASDLNTIKAALDGRLGALEKRRTALLEEEKKLTDWQRTIQPQWDFEIKHIDEWRASVDRFNARLEKALGQLPKGMARREGR